MTPMQRRLQTLEIARGIGDAIGGVLTFDPFTETPEEAVAKHLAGKRYRRAGFLVVPKMLDADVWETIVGPAQQRLLARAAHYAAHGTDPGCEGPFG